MLSKRYAVAAKFTFHNDPDTPTKFINGSIGGWRNIIDIAVVLGWNDQGTSGVIWPPPCRDETDDVWVAIKDIALPALNAGIFDAGGNHTKWTNGIAHFSLTMLGQDFRVGHFWLTRR